MVHAMEDVLSENVDYYYQKEKYCLKVINGDGVELDVKTLVHDDDIMEQCMSPGDYTASLNTKSYLKVNFGITFLYTVDNTDLFEEMKIAFARGYTRKID